MTSSGISRRHTLAGVAGVGLALPVLAACGGSSGSDSTASDQGGGGGGGGSTGGGGGGGGGGAFAKTTDVPEGGGAVFASAGCVVTQPTSGDFKGFSSTCTHQGCTVGSVDGGTINCPCHGSKFSIEDGSVKQGPATSPLPEVKLDVKGTSISKA